ncbi:nuclear transport factor 2 family protein [Azospirillum sp. ST 5-10]|uniref:nuclear transport factor 2 family protein n=1 Tax=unclassified Azospirillum TaxID=2630922 RepID=UPI003F4A43E6
MPSRATAAAAALAALAALAAVLPALAAAPAAAGPAGDRARAHFDAIAAADVPAITKAYADGAVLQWVGGPLDGAYTGPAAITAAWAKFAGAQGRIKADVRNLEEHANPAGATVTADVVFHGKQPVPVRYVLVYRGDALAAEVWQIAPQLAAGR